MGIIDIDVKILMKMQNAKKAEILLKSIEVDNIAKEPMKYSTYLSNENFCLEIKKINNINTTLSTILDIFSALDVSNSVYNLMVNQEKK